MSAAPRGMPTSQDLIEGFIQGVQALGLDLTPEKVLTAALRTGDAVNPALDLVHTGPDGRGADRMFAGGDLLSIRPL